MTHGFPSHIWDIVYRETVTESNLFPPEEVVFNIGARVRGSVGVLEGWWMGDARDPYDAKTSARAFIRV